MPERIGRRSVAPASCRRLCRPITATLNNVAHECGYAHDGPEHQVAEIQSKA